MRLLLATATAALLVGCASKGRMVMADGTLHEWTAGTGQRAVLTSGTVTIEPSPTFTTATLELAKFGIMYGTERLQQTVLQIAAESEK